MEQKSSEKGEGTLAQTARPPSIEGGLRLRMISNRPRVLCILSSSIFPDSSAKPPSWGCQVSAKTGWWISKLIYCWHTHKVILVAGEAGQARSSRRMTSGGPRFDREGILELLVWTAVCYRTAGGWRHILEGDHDSSSAGAAAVCYPGGVSLEWLGSRGASLLDPPPKVADDRNIPRCALDTQGSRFGVSCV